MATTTYGTPYVSGTDLVANWPAASLTVANSIDSAGYYIGRGNNTQTGSYTTVLTDAGKTVTMSNASANTVTIPPNSSVAYVVGTQINILNLGAGACTPTAGAGVTISGTITALAINGFASLVKTATNTWSYMPPGGFPASSTAVVATYQGTTSNTFVDLATVGPSVTITTGTKALVIISCYLSNATSGGGANMAFAVSGATTIAADAELSQNINPGGAYVIPPIQTAQAFIMTTLTAGSNVFTAKYSRESGTGTANFSRRNISVINLGS